MPEPLVTLTNDGLYCEAGGFHIDPWNPVPYSVITHAHGDHLCAGCEHYLVTRDSFQIFRVRMGDVAVAGLSYGERFERNGVHLSLHPAGHILGSAQVRLEYRGEVWVVSGDYKLADDPTCAPFEPVRCHTLITESTFGLPIYRWNSSVELFASINAWWRSNQAAGKTSLLFGHTLGKAQRLLAGIDSSIGPIFTHGAVERMTQAYRESNIVLPATQRVSEAVITRGKEKPWSGGLVIAPTWATSPAWLRRFEPYSDAIASGWMQIRGTRRRKAVDRGFPISDHADWPGLLTAINESGASRILATHGFAPVLARYCREMGLDGDVIVTRFGDEETNAEPDSEAEL
ncbi:MAG TPA: ligase-associated DNA damage response exonuclease [Schlesneria sp.]|jgi:putative mRNA 3-end processing factor